MSSLCYMNDVKDAGPTYYRMFLPTSGLADQGWEIDWCDDYQVDKRSGAMCGRQWNPDGKTETLITDVDVFLTKIWINKNGEHVTRRARSSGQKILADVDDHYWRLPDDNPSRMTTDPTIFPFANRDHYWKQIGACDAAIVSTPELEQFLTSRLDIPVYLRRNMIDVDLWGYRDVGASGVSPRVGWTGTTMYRQKDLKVPGGAIGEFVNGNGLSFAHLGHRDDAPTAAQLFGIEGKRVRRLFPQQNFSTFAAAFRMLDVDIGVVPLVDSPFNRAKSCLKGMEFAAAGIPFVASPLPEYEWFGACLLADSPSEWKNALDELRDPEFRVEMGERALERVQQEDYRVRAKAWFDGIV